MEQAIPLLINYGAGTAFVLLLIYNVYDRFFSKRAQEHREADEILSHTFRETIEILKTKVDRLEKDLFHAQTTIDDVKAENEVMLKILQGKDDSLLKYQERGLRIMDMVEKELYPWLKFLYDEKNKRGN